MQIQLPGQVKTRHRRSPNFPLAGTVKPFGLYPLYMHPVLPGETLQNLTTKIRMISKPIKHPLAGCWLETWVVYIKFTDIDRALGQMFIDDTYPTTGFTSAINNPRYFVKAGQIDWARRCTERVASSFFVHDNEALTIIDTVPQVKLSNNSWYQNLSFRPAGVVAANLPGEGADVQLTGFQMLQMMNMTELTYENYLKQFGVQSIVSGIGEPEILRYTRSWTQPVNTVEPTTGAPSSAFVWSEEINMDKPKRFDEPGFIIHLAAVRPKMYQGALPYSMVGNLWGFQDWFPVYNLDLPEGGVRLITSADAVIAPAAVTLGPFDLLYDHRDLLSHGEQFVNATTHPFALPTSNGLRIATGVTQSKLQGEYAELADINALFLSATAADQFLYYEGISMLTVDGHIKDTTSA